MKAVLPSTSTPAPTNKWTVRRRGELLGAHQVSEKTTCWLPGNHMQIALPGDYVITHVRLGVLDVTSHLNEYEVVQEGLFIPDIHRAELERVLGIGVMQSPEDLVRAVDRLARLEIGGILVDFTPGQWEELKRKAAVQSQTVEQFLSGRVKKFTQDLWGL